MTLDHAALVQRYLDTVALGVAEDVAALYTEDATLEDPVGGGEVHIGRQAIAGFYQSLSAGTMTAELLELRPGGHEVAFLFALNVDAGGAKMRIEPIEVMTFNSEGQVTSMKAYWTPADVKML